MMIFIWRFILNNYYYFNLFKSSGILISMCWLLEMAAWSGLTVRLLNILECRTSSFYPIFFMEKFHPKTILKHNLPVNLDILEFLVYTLHPTTLTKKKITMIEPMSMQYPFEILIFFFFKIPGIEPRIFWMGYNSFWRSWTRGDWTHKKNWDPMQYLGYCMSYNSFEWLRFKVKKLTFNLSL